MNAQVTTYNPEVNAKMRALILQAVNAEPGMTYPEIRTWIHEHYRFHLEEVSRRCQELANDKHLYPNGFPLRIKHDGRGHAHAYPT